MALLYDPGRFMPTTEADFTGTSWFRTWPDGPYHLHDVEPGGTVYLVRADSEQRIVWETRVTRMVAVPYEALDGFADEVHRRWDISLESIDMQPGGFCIGWMAEPVARLDRTARELPDYMQRSLAPGETLDLDGWQFGGELTAAFRYRWGLPAHDPSDEHFCTGRAPIGWFGDPPRPAGTRPW
jgi:hypothetical protein